MKINRVLVTTDFSENARRAYPYAASLARRFEARIHLVHFAGVMPAVISEANDEAFLDTLEKAVREEAVQAVFDGLTVTPHLQKDRWSPTKFRALEQSLEIDALVMATHGRSGFEHFVFGSFAERLVRNSSVPVLVCRDANSQVEFEPKLVIVPFDFSDVSNAIIPAVRLLSEKFQCSFRFVYVHEPAPPKGFPMVDAVREFLQRAPKKPLEERFSELAERHLSGVPATFEICKGVPAVEIVNRARDSQADLILVGTHGVLGSVAQNVTREAPCSVLTVPKPGVHDERLTL